MNSKKILHPSEIRSIVLSLGSQITNDYKDTKSTPLVIGVLSGSFMFLADLVREINLDIEVDFIKVSSYRDNHKISNPILKLYPSVKVESRDIILVEDIVDTGETIKFLVDYFKNQKCKSIKIVSLLKRVDCKVHVDYIGHRVEEGEFVVGYGMDNKGLSRNNPQIYAIV